MKKSLQQLVFGSLFAAILVAGSTANSQTTNKFKTFSPKARSAETAKAPVDAAKPKREWYPFYGIVATVDKAAKTVALKKIQGARLLQTDSQTTFEMNGKPASLADVKPGYYLHGKLHKEMTKEEYILDAKIELEAPAKNGTNHVAKAVAPAMATDDTATNAPVKLKKKKSKAAPDSSTK